MFQRLIDDFKASSGTVLRLSVWAGFNPVVRRAGNSWIVDIKGQAQRPDAPVEAVVHAEGTNASLIYPVLEPSGPISVSRTTEPPATPSGSPFQSMDTASRAAPPFTWNVAFLYAHGRPLVAYGNVGSVAGSSATLDRWSDVVA